MADLAISGSTMASSQLSTSINNVSTSKSRKKFRREQDFVIRDFMTALALCHNVTPMYPDANDRSIREF